MNDGERIALKVILHEQIHCLQNMSMLKDYQKKIDSLRDSLLWLDTSSAGICKSCGEKISYEQVSEMSVINQCESCTGKKRENNS